MLPISFPKIEHILGLGFFIFFPFMVIMPNGAAGWLLVVSALCFISVKKYKVSIPFPPISIALSLALFLGWLLLSAFWSLDPKQTLNRFWQVSGLMCSGLFLVQVASILSQKQALFIHKLFIQGFILGISFLIIDVCIGGELLAILKHKEVKTYQYTRTSTTLAILIWPAFYTLKNFINLRRWIFIAPLFFLGIGFLIFNLESDSAILAFLVGLLVWGLGIFSLQNIRYLLGTFIIVSFLTTPLWFATLSHFELPEKIISQVFTHPSYVHRLHIWKFVATRIFEKPVIGWGLDSSRHAHFAEQRISWVNKFPTKKKQNIVPLEEAIPLHPHNVIFQLWLELGAIGVAFSTFFLVSLLFFIKQAFAGKPVALLVAYASLSSALIVAFVSYGIWQSGWISSLWIVAILIRSLGRKPIHRPNLVIN